jgi:hypothetical protein
MWVLIMGRVEKNVFEYFGGPFRGVLEPQKSTAFFFFFENSCKSKLNPIYGSN